MDESEIDELIELSKKDPEEFDRVTRRMIDNTISSMPKRRQAMLKGVQWRIDVEKMKFKGSQLDFASNVFGIMWDQFSKMNDGLQMFKTATIYCKNATEEKRKKGGLKIIRP